MKRALLLALLAAAVVLAVLVLRAAGPSPPREEPAAAPTPLPLDEAALADRLAAALRIPTLSHSRGAPPEAEALAALRDFLSRSYPAAHAGLEREIVAGHSLLFRWRGADPGRPPALLMAHLDVVPVEPGTEGRWTHPPFAGTVAEGFVWGRGAVDDKSSVLGLLEAAELLVSVGFAPDRDLYFAFGHDEELGGEDGARAIARLLEERGVRLAFTLDEGMGIAGRGAIPGLRRDVALVATAEKGFLTLELRARGEGGHSSIPPRETAIGRLARAVAALEAHPLPGGLAPPVDQMLDALAPELPFSYRLVLRNRWLFGPLLPRLLAGQPQTAALVRTTTAPTLLRAGVKENVLASEARGVVNFRVRPGESVDDVVRHVRETIGDPQVEVEILEAREATVPSAPGGEGFELVARTVRELWPGTAVAPALTLAGTDSKHYGDVAEATLRFQPLRLTAEDAARIHGTDERVSVAAYADMVRFYVRLLENAGAPRGGSPAAR